MKKYVYMFPEGNGSMRELLGGKGANLAEMTGLGMPVPQGFTITTEACTRYYEDGKVIAANNWGKAKTVSQMVAILAVLGMQYVLELSHMHVFTVEDPLVLSTCFWLVGNVLIAIAVVLTLISGVTYLMQNIELFSDK